MDRAAAFATIAMLLGATTASAQPGQLPTPVQPAPPPPPQPPPQGAYAPPPAAYAPPMIRRTKRYGTKIAIADGISVAAMVVGFVVLIDEIVDGNDYGSDGALGVALIVGGGLSLVVTPALIHNSEGNTSGAWKSLAVRIGVPLVASLVAQVASNCDPSRQPCERGPLLDSLPGLLFLGGMAVDWLVFAKVTVTEPAPMMPYVAPAPYGGATMGLTGRF